MGDKRGLSPVTGDSPQAGTGCRTGAAHLAYISDVDVTLIAVAAVAGLATFLSPCVLPVLPVVAAASTTGGRRRPLGIAVGLAVAFVIFTLLASRVLSALGLPQDLLRNIAIGLLAVAGVALLVPALGEWIGRAFQPLATRAGGRLASGQGFWSGVGLGAGLALVWTPCAGPILAAVSALSAERRISLELVAITLAYAAGATLPLFALALLGQRAGGQLARVRSGGAAVRRISGAVLVAMAFLFTTDIPTQLAVSAPGYVSAIQGVERAHSISGDLRHLTASAANSPSAVAAGNSPDTLRNFGPAPDFTGITKWLNTPGSRPLSLRGLRGKVVLVDFWTYSCVNCIRTLPYLKAWYARYHRDGLVIVGVHTPEFAFEHVVANVQRAVHEHGIAYPVAVDDNYGTWDAWGNQYWPADYLIDRNGDVRDAHFGEGAYAKTQDDIRLLLGEQGTGPMAHAHDAITPSASVRTPETYLGTYRAAAYSQKLHPGEDWDYGAATGTAANTVALAGRWTVESHQIVAGAGARLLFNYIAPRIYLVAAPPRARAGHARRHGRRQAAGAGARARRRPVPARPPGGGRAAPARPVRPGRHDPLLVHVRLSVLAAQARAQAVQRGGARAGRDQIPAHRAVPALERADDVCHDARRRLGEHLPAGALLGVGRRGHPHGMARRQPLLALGIVAGDVGDRDARKPQDEGRDEPGAIAAADAVDAHGARRRRGDLADGRPEVRAEAVEELEIRPAQVLRGIGLGHTGFEHLAVVVVPLAEERHVHDLDRQLGEPVLGALDREAQIDDPAHPVFDERPHAAQAANVVGAHDDAEAGDGAVLGRKAAEVAHVLEPVPGKRPAHPGVRAGGATAGRPRSGGRTLRCGSR